MRRKITLAVTEKKRFVSEDESELMVQLHDSKFQMCDPTNTLKGILIEFSEDEKFEFQVDQ